MIVTVRVYRQHDMDLMTLAFDKSFHLGREMKRALVAVANKESYNGTTSDYLGTDTSGYVPKSIREQISLNPADPREKRAIDLLSEIKHGYRCSFIKALFRQSVLFTPLVGYTVSSNFAMRHNVALEPAPVEAAPVEAAPVEPAVEPAEPAEPVAEPVAEPPVLEESKESTDDLDALFQSMDKLGR